MEVIEQSWERLEGVGVKTIFKVNDEPKAEVVFHFEKNHEVKVDGYLSSLLDIKTDKRYQSYLSDLTKQAERLYKNTDW